MTDSLSQTDAPLKIALTHADLPNETKGGVAHAVHHLGNHLVARGHQVTMFTLSPAFSECLYQVHQLNSGKRSGKWASYQFAYYLRSVDFNAYDVIHTNGDNYLLQGRHPQVRTFMGSARDEMQTATSLQRKLKQLSLIALEQVGARAADVCTGISLTTQKRIPAVTRIVPPGVDLGRFSPGSKSENPSILFVGTVAGRKRGAWLAEIFGREISPRFPDAELWSVADAPLEGAKIVNFGRVSLGELARLNREAWVFCLPSTYEGFGIPYIEAMASGTVVVASPNPGALEITQDGEFGIIARDEELAGALIRVLGDAGERQRWEEAGLARAPLYSWDHVVASYEAVYREAIALAASRGRAARGRNAP